MPSSQRILQSTTNPPPSPADPPQPLSVDSDVVVILAALLCALICVVGLALVARCAWLRRAAAAASSRSNPPPPPPAKALKKKAIRSLPKTIYHPNLEPPCSAATADCPICLADFCEGDEMRALPQCGHRFHVGCIDTWLASHSSCPSCRQVLVVARCDRCGAAAARARPKPPGPEEDGYSGNSFLP